MRRRPDHGTDPEAFFAALDGPVAALARELRSLIRRAAPGASESIRWGLPVYSEHGLICAIRPATDYVALQFYASGTSLDDPDGLLEGTGRRMRHVKIRSRSGIRKRLFASWVRQAAGAAGPRA